MFGLIDPLYLIMIVPCMLLAGLATAAVKSAIARASRVGASSGMTGAQAAARILQSHGLGHVAVEPTRGFLGDHYDPRNKVLRLSPENYDGRSLAAVGIAAHEAGHAIQDSAGYAPLALRNGIVPLASIGSNLAFGLFFIGFFLNIMFAVKAAIVLFTMFVIFQLINLPVEFNASSRARELLVGNGIVTQSELQPVGNVLNAAAMTYVAATITAIVTLLYFLVRAGLLGGRDE